MSRIAIGVSIAVALVACPVAASASVVTFTDDVFNRADYNTMSLYASGMDVIPVFQCGLCGNPGSSLWVAGISTTEHGASSTAFINKNFAYNPVAAGAVASISVSVDKDLSTLDRLVGFGDTFYPTIVQGGNVYMATIRGPLLTGTSTGYNTLAASNLTAVDFEEYDLLRTASWRATTRISAAGRWSLA